MVSTSSDHEALEHTSNDKICFSRDRQRFLQKLSDLELTDGERSQKTPDLALDRCLTEQVGNKNGEVVIDATFEDAATYQMRTFLFAAYDTSSSSLYYCYHLLSIHPRIRVLVIKEHDEVFSPEPEQAASLISEKPRVLNQLPCTFAVIKETLQLYPPASNTGQGEPGFSSLVKS